MGFCACAKSCGKHLVVDCNVWVCRECFERVCGRVLIDFREDFCVCVLPLRAK